jgi:hypothetical protein
VPKGYSPPTYPAGAGPRWRHAVQVTPQRAVGPGEGRKVSQAGAARSEGTRRAPSRIPVFGRLRRPHPPPLHLHLHLKLKLKLNLNRARSFCEPEPPYTRYAEYGRPSNATSEISIWNIRQIT